MVKAESEIALSDNTIAGDITIGAGETDGVRLLTKVAQRLRKDYPLIHFHIISDDKSSVLEELDKGLIDFALLFGSVDKNKYEIMELPSDDRFGVMMRCDDVLADKKVISPEDLIGKPLIVSRQALIDREVDVLFAKTGEKPNIVGTYSLLFNGSLMVDEGMGYAICFDKIINTNGSTLCFKPFSRQLLPSMKFVWKKYQVLTKVAEKYVSVLSDVLLDDNLE